MDSVYGFLAPIADFLDKTLLDIELSRIVIIVSSIVLAFFLRRVVSNFVERVLKRLVSKTETKLDDYLIEALEQPLQIVTVVLALHINFLFFPWEAIIAPDRLDLFSTNVANVFGIIYTWIAAFFVWRLIHRFCDYLFEISQTNKTVDATIILTTRKFLKILVVFIAGVYTMHLLGQNVGVIVASFAVIGAGAAFAARDALANVFGAIVLSFDRPFSVGDWVIIGTSEGNVEEIGLRATRIRTFDKSLVHIPNNQVMNMTIENMSARPLQRVLTTLGVTYDASPDKIEALIEGVKKIVRNNANTNKDYCQVWFTGFGASSLDIMVAFYIESTELAKYLEVRQSVFLEIMKLVDSLGLQFAFPTQTINMDDKALARMGALFREAKGTGQEAKG
ncbi:MAG: mechanosensitive ion channel family protein [Candidatus Brocadiia bacterium]